MNPNTVPNYLTNSLASAKQVVGSVATQLQEAVKRKPWGQYQSEAGSVIRVAGEQLRNLKQAARVKQTQGVYPSGSYSSTVTQEKYGVPSAVRMAASVPADILTNATRRDIWKYTNVHRLVGDVGQYVGPRLGLDSTLAGATVAAGVPVLLGAMSGQAGPLSEGLRPKGQKAVAPVSKEEDPTGRTSRSALLEAAMRYGLGQKGQLLPYSEFKKERPDVAPSTYTQYRRYETMRPEPGRNVIVDPEGQSFSALGGVIRGTARGLNDPELRLKGVPITLSAAVGTAAGLGTIRALTKAAEPNVKIVPNQPTSTGEYANPTSNMPGFKKYTIEGPGVGARVAEKLGGYTEPAIVAAGALTALAVGKATKKLLQKSAERRLKKENPVEYLKHKHGSLEQASSALGQPNARSWQQLVPYIQ